jgi:hypothetical protein
VFLCLTNAARQSGAGEFPRNGVPSVIGFQIEPIVSSQESQNIAVNDFDFLAIGET